MRGLCLKRDDDAYTEMTYLEVPVNPYPLGSAPLCLFSKDHFFEAGTVVLKILPGNFRVNLMVHVGDKATGFQHKRNFGIQLFVNRWLSQSDLHFIEPAKNL